MLPGWTRYKLQSSGFVPCKPCTLHYYVRNLGKEGGAGEVARVCGVQSPDQWFSLQTLHITLLCKNPWTRMRSREKLPGWTGYNLQSSGFVPCKPCTLHYYVRSLEHKEEKQGEFAKVDGVQPPVKWFRSLQILDKTLLLKKSMKRRRSTEKLPGWKVCNLQSSGFVLCKPCTLHYYVRSLGTGKRSREKLPGWTGYNLQSIGFVTCKPCTLHYYVRSLEHKEEKQGEFARVDGVQPPVKWFRSLQILDKTLLRKKSMKRRRSTEKLPGWKVCNLQSSGFVPRKPCTLQYNVRSLGKGGETGKSCQGGWGTTSSQLVSFLANPIHYIIR